MMALGLLVTVNAQSQHEIHKKDGSILYVKVVEISLDAIKYVSPTDDSVLIEIDKAVVNKLVMGGEEQVISSGMDNPEFYADQRKKAIKFNFISPLSNYYLEVGYEKSLAPGRSLDFNVGFIGVGKSPGRLSYDGFYDYDLFDDFYYSVDEESVKGFFVRGGYKFINTPDYAMRGMRYSHLLKGGYIKPEVQIGSFYYDESRTDEFGNRETLANQSEVYGGLIINLGKQWVFSDIFLVDLSAGVGYGFSSNEDVNGNYSMSISQREGMGAAFRSSLNIGILLD
jgi:hypothetical protein